MPDPRVATDPRVMYHLTAPRPLLAGADAVWQEVEHLRDAFHGTIESWFPLRRYTPRIPPDAYGLHLLPRMLVRERSHDLHHVFHPGIYPFLALRALRRPVVFTVSAGVGSEELPRWFARVHLVISHERDQQILEARGVTNYSLVRPGIDAARFRLPPPAWDGGPFVLLAGSAPWTLDQFGSKGFDLLLELLQRLTQVRLVCLWRGLLLEEWRTRIRAAGVADRVEVINEAADVPAILSRVHAAVVLASSPLLVKAYPHSLMEAQASGRPVLLSDTIPMADRVAAARSGVVVPRMDIDALAHAVAELMGDYEACRGGAEQMGQAQFAITRMTDDYRAVYQRVLHAR